MNATPKTIALVDWLHMLTVQVKIAANDRDLSDHNRAGRRALAQLNAVRSSVGQDGHVVVCLDQPPYWRKKVYPEYKGQRAEREPEFKSILEWTLEAIRTDRFPIACAAGEEADDVMATLARIYSQEYGCEDVRLVGADKDGLQCVGPRVRLFVPKEGGEFDIRGEEWLLKNYGVKPSDFALLLAIMGDDSDNIGGIDGIGKGHGAKLINAYKTIDGMAKGLVAAQEAAQQPGAKPLAAVWKNYAAGMAKLPLWWKLTTLKTDVELELHPLKYLEQAPPPALVESDDDFDPAPLELDDDPRGDAWEPSAAELAAERQAMAAELPVGPGDGMSSARLDAMGYPPQAPVETRSAADRQVAAARAMSPAEHEALAAKRAAEMAAHDPSKMVIGKDPKADEALRALAAKSAPAASSGSTSAPTTPTAAATTPPPAASTSTAPSPQAPQTSPSTAAAPSAAGAASSPPAATQQGNAQLVPSSRGPRKPKVSDGIDQNESVVRVDAPSWGLQAQPSTAKELLQIAEIVFQSPIFRSFGTPHGTFAIMAYGRELGMGYMQALQSFCIVKEKPFMWAHAMRGIILAHPDCEFFVNVECTQEASTWITRRKSWPKDVPTAKYQFTYAEAVEIGLTTGPNAHNWKSNKRSMVDKTASSRLARQVWADVIGGLHAPEEEH